MIGHRPAITDEYCIHAIIMRFANDTQRPMSRGIFQVVLRTTESAFIPCCLSAHFHRKDSQR